MALSVRRSVIFVLLLVAAAGAVTYRAGSVVSAILLAEHTLPVYPEAPVEDAIHVVDLTGVGVAGARQLTSAGGENVPVGWSNDGSLLYVSDRIGRAAIFAQADGSAAARLISDHAGMSGHARTTPDGAAVLFTVGPSLLSTSQRIMRVGVDGGTPTEVVAGHFIDGGARCAVAPAMLCAVAERHDNGQHVIFSALNPQSGRGRELARVDGEDFRELRWDLSPDGTRIAIADARGSHVRIVMIGGPAAERISVSGAYGLGPISFTRDSRGVIVPAIQDDGVQLLSIGLQGTAQLLWEQHQAVDLAGLPSRDGRHVAVWVRTQHLAGP
jgi:hypothetical protein